MAPDAAPGDAHGAVALAEPQPATAGSDRSRPVAVTGASGFIGSHVVNVLVERGWRVRALVRDPGKAAARLAHLPVEIRAGDLRDADFLAHALDGAGTVVHLAAIAIESSGNDYVSTNADATRMLLDAAAAARADRFVHMSQNGSDSSSPYAFLRSKGIAQDAVQSSALRWTVLRPSVVFGPEDEFVNVLARLVRLTPLVLPLPDGGRARFQPVAVADVATVVASCVERDDTIHATYSLGGPAPLTLRDMARRILTALGTHRTIVGIPRGALRPLVGLASHALPHPPVTPALLDLLGIDNTVPDNAITPVFGIMPTPFAPEELLYLRRITAGSAFRALFAS